jgi:DHA2 family multidrug resistance protein
LTFATLSPTLRNEGTAVFSLMRNLGSSIGISVVEMLLTRNTQIMHATLAEHVTPMSAAVLAQQVLPYATAHGAVGLNALVTRQAAMIAYNNDFQLMLILSIAAIPLVLLLRRAGHGPTEAVAIE